MFWWSSRDGIGKRGRFWVLREFDGRGKTAEMSGRRGMNREKRGTMESVHI